MPQYISPQGFQVLKEEFDTLKSIERPKVVQEVSDAACQGDRSENAEYTYGKRRLREIDRRLRYLSRQFADMQVIDPLTPRGDKIYFGATVTLYDEEAGREVVYQILGPHDALDERRISYQSPVGRALLGRGLDDEIIVDTPKESKLFTVLDIAYK